MNGLEALRYLLPHVPFPAEIDNFIHRRIALSLHALGGAMALMTGSLQFLARFRESNWNRHRLLGWINCGAVLLGCCASVWMVPHAQTGWIAAWGFLTLGAAWIVTTGLAVRFILRGDGHAADLPAPCFRVLLTVCDRLSRIAWLCWIPNLIAVELYLHVVPTPSGITLPGRLEFRSRVFRTLEVVRSV